jgi:hypothetical protein
MYFCTRAVAKLAVLTLALPLLSEQREAAAFTTRNAKTATVLTTLNVSGEPARPPGSRFLFIKEAAGGVTAKFIVEDENGVRWRVKLGPEAKPETAATLLVRAAGFVADEDYYRAQIRVEGMKPIKHGKNYVTNDGWVREACLERFIKGRKREYWSWHDTHTRDPREFNGLRVMMALINNWDLKADNNSINEQNDGGLRLVVSDLGSSFGRTGALFIRSKGVVTDYAQTKFVEKVRGDHVDFVMNSRPCPLVMIIRPKYYLERTRMERITRDIPVADARWLGSRLARLSPEQIRRCFQDAGFSESEADVYTKTVLGRIDSLNKL